MSFPKEEVTLKKVTVMGQELPFNGTTPNLLASAGVMGSFLAIPLFDVPLLVSIVFSSVIIAAVNEVTHGKEGNKLRAHIQQVIGSEISRETAKNLSRIQLETNPQKEPPVYKRGDRKELDSIFDAIDETAGEVGLRIGKRTFEVIRYPKEPESVTWDKALDSTIEIFKMKPRGNNKKLLEC